MTNTHRATLNGETILFNAATMDASLDELVARHGGGVPTVEQIVEMPIPAVLAEVPVAKVFSTWEKTIVDEGAKVRIEAQQKALAEAGVNVDASKQYFATGTRMVEVGYDVQNSRKRIRDEQMTADCAAHELAMTVEAEKREDMVVTAREVAQYLTVNGKVKALGFALSEQAIRGLLGRLESPALGYVLGLRDRTIADAARLLTLEGDELEAARKLKQADMNKIGQVLLHECRRNPDVELKLRVRHGVGDCFAVVSPLYKPADAPQLVEKVLERLPAGARGSWSYDPATTAWELQADVWTPTPVEEQAVGEAFRGYVSFQSRDNGTSRFRGAGGVELLRCLNASTYCAENAKTNRRHVGKVMDDVQAMLDNAMVSINALCAAWGVARERVLDTSDWSEKQVEDWTGKTVHDLVPGLYRALLTDRQCVLAGVLPGRTEKHVKSLADAYREERRYQGADVRASDLMQGWTRYIQDQPEAVRRDAEMAAGRWLMGGAEMPVPVAAG